MLADVAPGIKSGSQRWVRVNDLASGEILKHLQAAMAVAPLGIVSAYLDMAETDHGVAAQPIGILAVCTETPSAVLRMSELLRKPYPRLRGMLWAGRI